MTTGRLDRSYGVAHEPAMHLGRQGFDPLAHLLGEPGQLGVLLEEFQKLCGLRRDERLVLRARGGEGLPVPRVGVGVRLVAVRLSGLRQQDERRGISCLQAEREIQQDEGIEVELGDADDIQGDPDRDDDGLYDQERRRPNPKKRANASAFTPNRSLPKAGARWACRAWKRK